jgi:hypothetical protein
MIIDEVQDVNPCDLRYSRHKNGIIENNLTKRAIQPIAVDRKNILFLESLNHASDAALLYSLIECCKVQRIDPHA